MTIFLFVCNLGLIIIVGGVVIFLFHILILNWFSKFLDAAFYNIPTEKDNCCGQGCNNHCESLDEDDYETEEM